MLFYFRICARFRIRTKTKINKRLSQSWIFFVGAGEKKLEICQKRGGQRKKNKTVKFANGRGGKGVGDEAGGSLPWPQ